MKISVLLVDDDPNIIQGLRRTLRGKQEWEVYCAPGGEEALGILAEHDIDIIVVDMYMPGMDGVDFLENVQEKYPHIIRMVFSGYSNPDLILRSTKLAHQFFAKPCDADILVEVIEHVWLFRDLVNNERLKDLITGITGLPSSPGLYTELLEYIQTPDASIKQIGNIVSRDMTMTAKILQLVNSAFFGLAQRVVDPLRAVALLGIENLKALILDIHIFSTFDSTKHSTVIDDLWKHSISVGRLAREIAMLERCPQSTIDDALTTGALHDIGKLVLLYAGEKTPVSLKDEYDTLGTSHAEAGAYLLGLWGIPASIVRGVAYHHRPSGSGENAFTSSMAVHVANALLSNDSAGGSLISGLDYSYLNSIGKSDRLPVWVDCYIQLGLGFRGGLFPPLKP